MLAEFDLIRRYFMSPQEAQATDGVALGCGDDATLLVPQAGQQLAVTVPADSGPGSLLQSAVAMQSGQLAVTAVRPKPVHGVQTVAAVVAPPHPAPSSANAPASRIGLSRRKATRGR